MQKRTLAEIAATCVVVVVGFWSWFRPAPHVALAPPARISQPGLTLWLAGDQPRPGSVYRVWTADGVGRADLISNMIADRITPVRGAAADVSVLINDARLLQATATLTSAFNAKVGADIGKSGSTPLATKGTEVFRIPDRSDFLVTLQAWDGAKKKDEREANLFSEIRHPVLGSLEPDPTEGARYVVTEVRRVAQFKYEVLSRERDRAGFDCKEGGDGRGCGTIGVGSNLRAVDGRSSHEPLTAFFALKRILYNNSALYYAPIYAAPVGVA